MDLGNVLFILSPVILAFQILVAKMLPDNYLSRLRTIDSSALSKHNVKTISVIVSIKPLLP